MATVIIEFLRNGLFNFARTYILRLLILAKHFFARTLMNLGEQMKIFSGERLVREQNRLFGMSSYERELHEKGYGYICGIDEAGRGPLAGPVVAAACILKPDTVILGINDSKKLSEKTREFLYDQIVDNCVDFAVSVVNNDIIDDINILEATKMAMLLSIEKLSVKPDALLIDAVKLDCDILSWSIIRGDGLSVSIACASILAKVTRDKIMRQYDEIYPEYGFSKHKGYGTKAHISAIKIYGLSPIHKKTFCKKIYIPKV